MEMIWTLRIRCQKNLMSFHFQSVLTNNYFCELVKEAFLKLSKYLSHPNKAKGHSMSYIQSSVMRVRSDTFGDPIFQKGLQN